MRILDEIPRLDAILPLVLAERAADVMDLTLRRRPDGLSGGEIEDQAGHPGAATILDLWVRDWVEVRERGEGYPVQTVPILCHWLAARLDWACDRHMAVDDFAKEIRELLAAQRAVLDRDLRPRRYQAPCPRCETQTLIRKVGADWIGCSSCGSLWSEGEYADLARESVHPDEMLSTWEASVIARVSEDVIRQWKARGRLTGETVDGRTWYRRGDVDAAKVARSTAVDTQINSVSH